LLHGGNPACRSAEGDAPERRRDEMTGKIPADIEVLKRDFDVFRRHRPERFPMMRIPKIHICGVPELELALRSPFTHVVSIWDPEWIERGGIEQQLRKRLRIETRLHIAYFHDLSWEEPGRRAPVEDDLRQILSFAADLRPEGSVLIHCWAGVSRSTAVAYAILCQSTGPGRELDCFESVLAVRPQAFPNALIVELADRILERNGAMRRACEKLMSRLFSQDET
jgi:predicted protein tyrosine phosphatase